MLEDNIVMFHVWYLCYTNTDTHMKWCATNDADTHPNIFTQTTFRYDFVDVTRQSIQVILIKYYNDLIAASKAKDMSKLT